MLLLGLSAKLAAQKTEVFTHADIFAVYEKIGDGQLTKVDSGTCYMDVYLNTDTIIIQTEPGLTLTIKEVVDSIDVENGYKLVFLPKIPPGLTVILICTS